MRVCLFEDRHVENLQPLTLTRAAFDLLCGLGSLGDKQWSNFHAHDFGALVRPDLAAVQRQRMPHVAVNHRHWLDADAAVMVNGRWLPPEGSPPDGDQPCVGLCGEEVAYAVLPRELLEYCSPNTIDDCIETWKQTLPHHDAGGAMVQHLWDLVDRNGEQIERDFEAAFRDRGPIALPGLAVLGPWERLFVHDSAKLDPMVVIDTTGGPVVIAEEVVVTAFTRLEGPCYIGAGTHVLGAKIRAGTTLGPCCRIGGEVEASIVQGYSNKYHDGFLGHSYLGEWVNIGAGTHNSDLRNDYGPVTVTVAGRQINTGKTKVGCYLGDHTKTGLGTLLNTGTTAGVFCNLLPCGGFLPKYVPSFCSVWNGRLTENGELESLLATAAKVMERRGCEMTTELDAVYRSAMEATSKERRSALRQGELRRLRLSA